MKSKYTGIALVLGLVGMFTLGMTAQARANGIIEIFGYTQLKAAIPPNTPVYVLFYSLNYDLYPACKGQDGLADKVADSFPGMKFLAVNVDNNPAPVGSDKNNDWLAKHFRVEALPKHFMVTYEGKTGKPRILGYTGRCTKADLVWFIKKTIVDLGR